MAPEVAEVLKTVRSLTDEQRADLAYQVLLTLDDHRPGVDQAAIDTAWREELGRRADAYRAGTAELVDVDESHDALRAELAARRQ